MVAATETVGGSCLGGGDGDDQGLVLRLGSFWWSATPCPQWPQLHRAAWGPRATAGAGEQRIGSEAELLAMMPTLKTPYSPPPNLTSLWPQPLCRCGWRRGAAVSMVPYCPLSVGDEGRRREKGPDSPGVAAPLRGRGWPSGARDSAGVGVVGPGARRLRRRERLLCELFGDV